MSSDVADDHLTIAEIASVPQIADEIRPDALWRLALCRELAGYTVLIGGRRFFVRSRLAKRLASVDLRPRSRKGRRPPPEPQTAVGECVDATE